MTDQGPGNEQPPPMRAPPLAPAKPPAPFVAPPLHPFVAGLMIIFGIILLLPGICAVTFMVAMALPGGNFTGEFVPLWLICLTISAAGIYMIRAARRSRSVDRKAA